MASSEISHAPILSAATATASATAAAAATMSKSKKKRMQRAKAKQRKEEEQQPGNGSIGMSSIPANSLNPLDSIRSDLVKLGYELSYVDKAMDEMWTQQLDYSDMDSVLTFIQERDKRRSVDVLASASTVSATSTATATALDDLEEYSTVPTTDSGLVQDGKIAEDSGSPTPTENSSSRSTHRSTPNGNGNGNASPTPCAVPLITTANTSTDADADAEAQEYPPKHTSISTTQDPTTTGTKLKKQTKGEQPLTQPLSLSAKLDIVAQSQDLTDGIIALTEWVVKAATPPQIMELCECNDSNTNKNSNTNNNADANALKTVIKRIILSGDRKYTGQLLDLIGTILRTVGAPSTQLVSSAKALGMLLKRTSEACADNTTDQLKGAIANSVSEHAAKIVASVVKSMIQDSASVVHAYASKNVEADMHQLLQGASDKSKNSRKSVVDLMANRDKSKSVSEKYSVLVEVSIQEQESQADASKDADNASTAGAVATPLDESEVVKDMLGDNYHSVVTSKAKMMELKSREEQMNNSIPERVELLERRRLQNEEKERIGSRIQQLRAELLQLEQEEKEVMAKVEDSELKLEIMDGSFSEEAKQVREELEAVSQKVKVEACVSQVAQQLCEFDSAMKAVSNSQSQPKKADDDNDDGESSKGEEDDIASKVGNALNCYLRVTSFYFSSELNVLSFLTARATNIEAEIPTLVSTTRTRTRTQKVNVC
jgi:hypothetical protein